MNIGPYFRCYQTEFQDGIAALDADQTTFYVRLILRMYDTADAVYTDGRRGHLTDRDIARMANSNVRKWKRVRDELIALGKLTQAEDGALMNRPALREMLRSSMDRQGTDSQVPDEVLQRLGKLSEMFGQSFPKVCRKFRKTCLKNLNENNEAKGHILTPTPTLTSNIYSDALKRFESAYPPCDYRKPQETAAAFAALPETDLTAVVQSAEAYAAHIAAVGGKFVRRPDGFIRDGIWRDYADKAPKSVPVALPDPGTVEDRLRQAVVSDHGADVWRSWFAADKVRVVSSGQDRDVIHPFSGFVASRIQERYVETVTRAGFVLGAVAGADRAGAPIKGALS